MLYYVSQKLHSTTQLFTVMLQFDDFSPSLWDIDVSFLYVFLVGSLNWTAINKMILQIATIWGAMCWTGVGVACAECVLWSPLVRDVCYRVFVHGQKTPPSNSHLLTLGCEVPFLMILKFINSKSPTDRRFGPIRNDQVLRETRYTQI